MPDQQNMRRFCSIIIVLLLSGTVHAQQRIVHGILKDSLTELPITGGTITNANTKKSITTQSNGYFQLQASPGDVIYAVAKNYRFDTLRYSALARDTIIITLAPKGDLLAPVTVEASYAQYQLDSAQRRKEFEQNRGQVYSRVDKSRSEGFGLNINLNNKKLKQQKKDEESFTRQEQLIYVNFRYPPQLVAMYTGYRGDTLSRFMQFSNPTYQWLRQHPTREELVYYISDQLKAFKARGMK